MIASKHKNSGDRNSDILQRIHKPLLLREKVIVLGLKKMSAYNENTSKNNHSSAAGHLTLIFTVLDMI